MFVLHSSKTHNKSNKPQIIKISASKLPQNKKLQHQNSERWKLNSKSTLSCITCPYQLLRNYVAKRKNYKSPTEQFFVFKDRSPVLCSHFNKILKKCLVKAKLNDRLYTSHCFRSGRSSDLLQMGVPIDLIKKLGRWHSNYVCTYFR